MQSRAVFFDYILIFPPVLEIIRKKSDAFSIISVRGIAMKISELTAKTKIIIAAAAVIVTAAVVIIVMLSGGKAEVYRVLKIFGMTGEASVDRSSMKLSAYTGMNMESGDVLSVMKDSSVHISPTLTLSTAMFRYSSLIRTVKTRAKR